MELSYRTGHTVNACPVLIVLAAVLGVLVEAFAPQKARRTLRFCCRSSRCSPPRCCNRTLEPGLEQSVA